MPHELAQILTQCLNEDPLQRPALATLQAVLQKTTPSTDDGQEDQPILERSETRCSPDRLRSAIISGQEGLLRSVLQEEDEGLWLSPPVGQHDSAVPGSHWQVRRSANRGVAGPVYLLSRLARFGCAPSAGVRVRMGAEWLLTDAPAPDAGMPGLHFGEAGVAVALSEAIDAGLLARTELVNAFLHKALAGPLDWPDLTHGAAGQGVASLYCADRLSDASIRALSHRCADYLISSQNADGSWMMPPGVDGMSGQILTGFAHGVAGIVYFLAEYARRFGGPATQAYQTGAAWLIKEAVATPPSEVLQWHYATTVREAWTWWCHGGPGIALTFLRLYQHSGSSVR